MMDGSQRFSVNCVLPVASLVALLGAPQGSLALDAPSPKGSLDGEVSAGGAGEPHASSALAGAAAKWVHRNSIKSYVLSQVWGISLHKCIPKFQK